MSPIKRIRSKRAKAKHPQPTPEAFPFDPTDAAFNRHNAIYLAHASDIAYHRAPTRAARERLGLQSFAFLNKITRTRGFLGVCDTHAVLAFRGTDPITLPNWVTDAVVRLIACDDYHGRVHSGFHNALRRTWQKVETILEQVCDKPLFITGHSLGGALAVLTACRLAKAGRPPVATYTFGVPRVGDPSFCDGYLLPTYRVVNRLDLVPEMPIASVKKLLPEKPRLTNEKILGQLKRMADRMPCYGHVKTLVYIDRDGTISMDADIAPWHAHAVQRAIATRGTSFLEGITDHLIGNYIRGLEGKVGKKQTGNRRRAV
ncbi:MAG: lipase family protein [Tepidisphaeraceae bacterium]